MFGANGEVIYAPPGSDCQPSAQLTPPPRPGDFAVPAADPDGAWAPVRPGEEALYQLVEKREASRGDAPFAVENRRGTQHVAVPRPPTAGGPSPMTLAHDPRPMTLAP